MNNFITTEYAAQRIPELEKICQIRPSLYAMADLGACYFTAGDAEKALPLLKRVCESRKDYGIGTNLAMVYKDLGMHAESFRAIEDAYWMHPEEPYTRLAYAEAMLRAGFWKQAWEIYDNTRPTQQAAALEVGLPANAQEWDGRPLPEGHKLLVINEGGTGDRLSYPRWLPELTKRGIDWIFYPFDELHSFYARIFPAERLVKLGEQITVTHWTTPFSLPAKLKVGPTEIPPPLAYTAKPEEIEKFPITRQDKLPVVGLCYSAAELFQGGRKVRSLTEGQAMRLVCMTGDKIHWVSLQHGIKLPYPVINVPLTDWESTAGLIANLDAVVSVDTGVMHLAGGMNRPMAVLLSSNSCWKFLSKKKYLPLYPSATFYRNEGHGRGMEHALNSLITDIRSGVWPPKSA